MNFWGYIPFLISYMPPTYSFFKKSDAPSKIFAGSAATYFAASCRTNTSLDEFRNFSEYSEIYSSPFSPIPMVANMPGIADLKSGGDSLRSATVANMPGIADLKSGGDSLRSATVANMPGIAAVRVRINLDCCKYRLKCCRRGPKVR